MNASFIGKEGQDCLDSTLAGKDLHVIEDCKPNMTQRCHDVGVRHTRVDASSQTVLK